MENLQFYELQAAGVDPEKGNIKLLRRALLRPQDLQAKLDKCKLNAFLRALGKIEEKQFTILIESGKLDECPHILQSRSMAMKEIDQLMWITINPEFEPPKNLQNVTNLLIKQTDKYLRRTYIENAAWAYEQKGTNEETLGQHPHVHMLIEFNDIPKKSHFWRDIHNTFKALCKAWDCFINARVCKPDHMMRRLSYLTKKHYMQDLDVVTNKIWRNQYNLEDIYFTPSWGEKRGQISPLAHYENDNTDSEYEDL